jgi:DNA-binding NtrC family response regulator
MAIVAADASRDPLLQAMACMAHLRVLTAAGDFALARECLDAVLRLSRVIHSPLRRARACLVWMEALRRAGRHADAQVFERRVRRLARAAPPLLARHIEAVAAARTAPRRERAAEAPRGVQPPAITLSLLDLSQSAEDDMLALQAMLGQIATSLRAGRVEVQSSAAGAVATLAAAGGGLQPRIGVRALEAELTVGPESVDGSWQAAVPIRLGRRALGALACRWPIGRTPTDGVASILEIAAAIAAPRVEAVLARNAHVTQAASAMPQLVGVSEAVMDVRRAVARAAASPFSVLIEGESGVGKELIARAIHQLSARRDRRFCDVNCAALPDELVESELFGHARGAFTGAVAERRGLFEEAHGGTLFLDELPDLSLRAQAKLLRVVQQGELRRVGETFTRKVDVRLVTATNRCLGREVTEGRFRQDLLYRVDVIRVRVPPLRERPEDVPSLAQHFWTTAAERAGTRAALSHALIADLARYHWPGNVRELQNVITALAVAAPARGMVRPSLLPSAITGATAVTAARLVDARRQFERRFVEVALARAGGSRSRAAVHLGLTRQGLLKVLARLGLG